jgi:hypothetical protein
MVSLGHIMRVKKYSGLAKESSSLLLFFVPRDTLAVGVHRTVYFACGRSSRILVCTRCNPERTFPSSFFCIPPLDTFRS